MFGHRKHEGSPFSHRQKRGSPFSRWDNEGSPFIHPGGNFGFKQRESAPDFAEWQKCEPQLMSRAVLMRTARIPVEFPSTPSILGDRSSDLNQLLASWIMKTRLLVDSRYFRCWNRDRGPYLDISDAGTEIAGSISAGQMAETRIPAPSYRPRRRERGCWLAIGSGGGGGSTAPGVVSDLASSLTPPSPRVLISSSPLVSSRILDGRKPHPGWLGRNGLCRFGQGVAAGWGSGVDVHQEVVRMVTAF